MQYRQLGRSGLHVSVIGLGTNAFGSRADKDTSIRILHEALNAGINFIDTANVYSSTQSEQIIGEALRDRRHDAVLATKAGMVRGDGPNERGSSRAHLFHEIDESLRRLQTDYIDLYQIHTFDPHTPLDETLRALDDLVCAGKIRYIGASNYAAWELMKALAISDYRRLARYVSVQPCYSLADRTVEIELVPLCLDQGVGLIPYFPLAGGILTGKYGDGQAPAGSRADKDAKYAARLDADRLTLGAAVTDIAGRLGMSASVLSLAWLVSQPVVSTIIVGATKSAQLQENVTAAAIRLDAATMQELNEKSAAFRFATPFAEFRLPPRRDA